MNDITPPIALSKFKNNLNDNIRPLLDLYQFPSQVIAGPEPFYNSSILVLASYWEAFCVDLIIEGCAFYHYLDSYEKLSPSFKKTLSLEIKKDKHELSGWKLAGKKWKDFIINRAKELRNDNYKFPNAKPTTVENIFEEYLGIELQNDIWIVESFDSNREMNPISEFIEIRNEIAHEGGSERVVERKFPSLIKNALLEVAKDLAKEIDTYFLHLTGERFYEYEKVN